MGNFKSTMVFLTAPQYSEDVFLFTPKCEQVTTLGEKIRATDIYMPVLLMSQLRPNKQHASIYHLIRQHM